MPKEKTFRRIKKILMVLIAFFSLLGLIGLGLKLVNISGGSILFVLAIPLLASIYWPFAIFFVWHQEFKQQKILLSLAFGLSVSVLLIGILFKTQQWVNGLAFQVAGTILVSILTIIFTVLKRSSDTYLFQYYKSLAKHAAIFTIIGIVFYLLPDSTFTTNTYTQIETEQSQIISNDED